MSPFAKPTLIINALCANGFRKVDQPTGKYEPPKDNVVLQYRDKKVVVPKSVDRMAFAAIQRKTSLPLGAFKAR